MSEINGTVQVKLLNNQGGGFAELHTVSAGTTVIDFFTSKVGGDADRYKLSLNGEPATAQDVITPACGAEFARVVITPMKIEGA